MAVGWRLLSRSSIHFDPRSFKITRSHGRLDPLPARLRMVLGRATSLGSHAASAALREAVLPELNMSSDARPPGDTFCLLAAHLPVRLAHRRPWWAPRMARSGLKRQGQPRMDFRSSVHLPGTNRAACQSGAGPRPESGWQVTARVLDVGGRRDVLLRCRKKNCEYEGKGCGTSSVS